MKPIDKVKQQKRIREHMYSWCVFLIHFTNPSNKVFCTHPGGELYFKKLTDFEGDEACTKEDWYDCPLNSMFNFRKEIGK